MGHGEGVRAIHEGIGNLSQNVDAAHNHVPHEHLAHVGLLLGDDQTGANETHDHAQNRSRTNDL